MAYDLLIKNGRVVDGSGAPAFRADVGVRNGKIAEIGKLRGSAARTIDADGLVVSPGFIDNHCHYDAQVTWDPLCEFSCYHGATSVVIGNCSLALAPVHPGSEERLAEFLSFVEVIPMEVLKTVKVTWHTIAEYLDTLDKRMGVNVGSLIGHSAVRQYVMGNESQGRTATPDEIDKMRGVVRDGMTAGALGMSFDRNKSHYDSQGVTIPSPWAAEDELFALAGVLGELGTGVIQCGQGRGAEMKSRMMSRLSETIARPVIYSNLSQSERNPIWKEHMAVVDETVKAGIRAIPMTSPNSHVTRFTMHNAQVFKGVPSVHSLIRASDEEKLRAYRDPELRRKLHDEVVEWKGEMPGSTIARRWPDYISVGAAALPKNKQLEGKSIREVAAAQGKGFIDAFLDLAIEENLDTGFLQGHMGTDKDAMAKILNYPNTIIGLSDGGAHVQFHGGAGYSTRLLGYWVRERGIMTVEQAVKKLTFDSGSLFGIYDRGLLRPGLAADITIFNPDTVNPLPEEKVHDLPAGAWRLRELASGIHYTIVNGQVLLEDGRHTGALPGRVLRNTLYREPGRA